MTIDLIGNKADFQRYLNGCEQRLIDLSKSLQMIEKISQKLLPKNTSEEQEIYFNQLNTVMSQLKSLYSSLITLTQSSFASSGKKRLNLFKQNLEKIRLKFQQIQYDAHMKFAYEYDEEQYQLTNNEEQLQKLIENKCPDDEQIELDLLHERTIHVQQLEKDIHVVHETFFDINRIIHEQGTIVNNIEQALTNTDQMIEEASETVKKTVETHKRTRRLKWIFILVLICLIFLLVIILYFTLKLAIPYG